MDLELAEKLQKVDKHNLDTELERNGDHVASVGTQYALAKSRVAEAKEALKVTDAIVSENVRALAEEEGRKKATEAWIQSQILISEEHADAARNLRQAELTMDLWEAQKSGMYGRNTAIVELCKLDAREYFDRETVVITDTVKKKRNAVEAAAKKKTIKNKRKRPKRTKK